MKNKKVNVLITSMGANTAVSVAKGLRQAPRLLGKIIGVDAAKRKEVAGIPFCDEFITVPNCDSEKKYIESILRICKRLDVSVVIPIFDKEVEILTKYQGQFAKAGVSLCASSYEVVKACNDKLATFEALHKKIIGIPKTFIDREKALEELSFPMFVKPRRGVSSVGCFKVENKEELSFALHKTREMEPLIQECIDGTHYTVDIVNDQNGKNIIAVPRVETAAKAGIAVRAFTDNAKDVREYAVSIAEALGVSGPANIELLKKGKELRLIEVNPRFSAGSILSTVSGPNIHWIAVSLALGQSWKTFLKKGKKVWMARYWQETFFA